MGKFRKSLSAKLSAFILMMALVVLFTYSSIIIVTNVTGEWYSVGENAVKNEIYQQTAEAAERNILESVYELSLDEDAVFYATESIEEGYGTETDIENDEADEAAPEEESDEEMYIRLIQQNDDELIVGERSVYEFGYVLYPYVFSSDGSREVDKEHPVKQVNPELSEQEGVFITGVDHNYFRLEIYLGQLSADQLPDYVAPIYKYGNLAYSCRYIAIVTAVLSFIAALFLLIFLIKSVGENALKESDAYNERRAFAIKAVPLDLTAGVLILVGAFTVTSGVSEMLYVGEDNFDLMVALITAMVAIATVLYSGLILLLAARVKLGKWWHSTVIYQVIRFLRWICLKIKELFTMIPIVWKTSLILAGGLIINIFLTILISDAMWFGSSAVAVFLWVIAAVTVSYGVLRFALGLKRLKEGGKHLADGDLDYYIDERGLFLDLREHAQNLNNIGKGMEAAVSVKMQSERFKNELITNVSHDLKTPLTSIINYVDLLKKENLENDNAKEYIDVLDRQSQRLKKLTEDVVEASKVATGNIKMDMLPCQVGVLMTQLMGEYSEKAKENDLEFIIDMPKEEIEILADGRCMWRIFNNLLSNICKYSMPGTRVYQTLEAKEGKAVIVYKNISKYELNISGKELTERFVRGDSSRHTEGSGLGLSIAENLVELQGGRFEIQIDGDLFKVIMEFDLLQ